jgi:hypothetical protein
MGVLPLTALHHLFRRSTGSAALHGAWAPCVRVDDRGNVPALHFVTSEGWWWGGARNGVGDIGDIIDDSIVSLILPVYEYPVCPVQVLVRVHNKYSKVPTYRFHTVLEGVA